MYLITTQCFPPKSGGIESLMGGLANALNRAGHSVEVFADGAVPAGGANASGYSIRRFSGFKPWRRRSKAWAIHRTCSKEPVEGLFADSWKSVELLPALSVPIGVLAHGMEFPVAPGAAKVRRMRRAFARAAVVIANSNFTAEAARPYVPAHIPIKVIHPPICSSSGAQLEPEQAEPVLQPLPPGRGPMLLTLARLEPRKGVDMVIRALPRLRRRYPQLHYVVAGDGPDRLRLAELAESLGVAEAVTFTGRVGEAAKASLYRHADIFAMPVRREGNSVEGFGIVYREAGCCGLPVLAGREGGAPDAVLEGETGLLCNGDDPADVERMLESLLADSDLRYRLGERAKELAHGPWQWHESIERYLEALQHQQAY